MTCLLEYLLIFLENNWILLCDVGLFDKYLTVMPVVVYQPSQIGSNIGTASSGPQSHICLACFVFCINPLLGLVALIFAIASKAAASSDWDGAHFRGRISFGFSLAGIVTSMIALLVFVLVFFTKDTQ